MPQRRPERGFTLTELTIVLVIVALLIGGLTIPLSTQRNLQNLNETQKSLAEIKEALLGFAVIYGRLPCPSTTTDPASTSYGVEDTSCTDVEGYLPWKSLGVAETDAWGSRRNTAGDLFTGYWRYRVDNALKSTFSLTTTPTSNLVVYNAAGSPLTQTSTDNTPVAIVYSTGPNRVADGRNVNSNAGPTTDREYQGGEMTSTFDDILIWIGRPALTSRMISAGKLP